ncbi:MAG: GAF domain-containing sensor histidine kinase [Mucilaginibacter sp.]
MMEAYNDNASQIAHERRKTEIVSLISLELSKPVTLKEKLNNILYFLDNIFGLKHTMLLLPDGEEHLTVFASRGFGEKGLGAKIKFGQGVIGVVAARKKKLRLNNISWQKQYIHKVAEEPIHIIELPGLPNAESQVAIPLLADEKLIAVLSAESEDLNFFDVEDEEFLMTLSQIIGLSIQNTQIVEGLEATVRERTHHLELQKQMLQQANSSKDRLFSIISHDLRSPVAALQSVSKLMHYYINSGDMSSAIKTAERVAKSTQGLHTMLDKLLAWSLTQTGDIKIEQVQVDIVTLLKEVLEVYEDAISSKNIICNFNAPGFSAMVTSDMNACFTIFHNIISNAVKFSFEKGVISINLHPENTYLKVTISDTGTGIPEDKINDILSNPVNVSSKGTANEKGTGVGLAASFYMAKRVGATIDISSSPGAGTTVSVNFPV